MIGLLNPFHAKLVLFLLKQKLTKLAFKHLELVANILNDSKIFNNEYLAECNLQQTIDKIL